MSCQHCYHRHQGKPNRSEAENTRLLYNRCLWFLAVCAPISALIMALFAPALFATSLDPPPKGIILITGLSGTALTACLAGIILGLATKKSAIAEAAAKDQRRIAKAGGL